MDEESLAASREKLKRDLTGLPTKESLAKRELENGVFPKFVAMKYGLDIDRCAKYAAAFHERRERERTQSVRSNRQAPSIG